MGTALGNFSARTIVIDNEIIPESDPNKWKITHLGYAWTGEGRAIHLVDEYFGWMQLLDYIDRFTFKGIRFRKEVRRHGLYWYAFKKVKGKLKKLYCGEKANLRLEHLEGYYNKFMAG